MQFDPANKPPYQGGPPPPGYGGPTPGYGPPPPGYGPPPGHGYGGPPQQGAPMGAPLPNVPGADRVAAGMHSPTPNVPRVEHLAQIPILYVRQRIDLFELFMDYDVSNQYEVYLNDESRKAGARWLYAKEESDCCQRVCFPRCREFTLDVGIAAPNSNGRPQTLEQQMGLVSSKFVHPMIRIHRPFALCLQSFTLSDGNGAHIATGQEDCCNLITCCPITTHINGPGNTNEPNGSGDYKIEGPTSCMVQCIGQCPCRGDLDFVMTDKNGRRVGMVANEPNGWLKMCFTNADDYRVEFDPGASPPERAMLLAMAFMLDFRYFEAKQQKQQ